MAVGCTEFLVKKDQSQQVYQPSSAAVSPKMDFEKITSVAIFPFFPSGNIEDPDAAERLGTNFESELITRQSQWKIYTHRDVLTAIAKHNLGRGYKNFQADVNTARGQSGSFILTEETKSFLKKLASAMKVNAIIYGNYNVNSNRQMVQSLFGPVQQLITNTEVSVALYFVPTDEIWWKATDKQVGNDRESLISSASKSLSTFVGKGTLQQL